MINIDTVIRSFSYCLDFVEEQVADLDTDEMVQQTEFIANHPAWVIGHLTASCQAMGRELGLEPWLDSDWGKRFGYGSQPVSDTSEYCSKEELISILRDSKNRIIEKVSGMNSAELEQPLPEARLRDQLPTIGDALAQMLASHTAYHIGQLQIWRKTIGKPALERPFL